MAAVWPLHRQPNTTLSLPLRQAGIGATHSQRWLTQSLAVPACCTKGFRADAFLLHTWQVDQKFRASNNHLSHVQQHNMELKGQVGTNGPIVTGAGLNLPSKSTYGSTSVVIHASPCIVLLPFIGLSATQMLLVLIGLTSCSSSTLK